VDCGLVSGVADSTAISGGPPKDSFLPKPRLAISCEGVVGDWKAGSSTGSDLALWAFESPHICWLVSPPQLLCPVCCDLRYGLFVCSGIDPFDCSETLLMAPYEAELAPVGMGEMFSMERLMGIPAGGPGRKASGKVLFVMGAFPPAGFNAAGTSLALTSSKSSSSDRSHSSSSL
jgi:hypothetical protein